MGINLCPIAHQRVDSMSKFQLDTVSTLQLAHNATYLFGVIIYLMYYNHVVIQLLCYGHYNVSIDRDI